MKKCCIVIITHKERLDGNDELSLKQALKVFGKKYDIKLVIPHSISTNYYDEYLNLFEYVKVNDEWLSSIKAYNRMQCSKEFYELFKEYEYMLNYETDAWVYEDRLDEFINLGYDWYGAPWPMTNKFVNMKKNDVGNGGLSLRKISKMIEITSNNQYDPKSYYKNQDIFFCKLHGDKMKICPWEIAVNFSLETVSDELIENIKSIPMGLHGKHLIEVWDNDGKKLKERYFKNSKKITVITINYNNAKGLKKTIHTVTTQTYFDKIEYVVIDGGSTDGSKEIIEQNKDKITYWCSEQDNGIYNAMNKGISHSNGEYLLFLNSGDMLFSPTSIEEAYENLTEDIIYGDLCVVSNAEKDVYIKKYPSVITKEYLLRDSLPHPSTFIKKELFENEKYDESFKIISDWAFFYKQILSKKCSYKHIKSITSVFYLGGVSSNVNLIEKEKKSFFKKIERRKPRITIIMPCYNYSNYIKEAIDSLKSSTCEQWNCIIINDGSTDNSEDVIFSQIEDDERFTYIKQTNKGPSASRNIGIRASNTKYIMCLDPDDKISSTYIENGINYLDENDDCTLYYGKAKCFYDDGSEKDWNLPEYNYKQLIYSNCIYSSFIYRKEDYERIGGYDEGMRGYEDWDFLIRLLSNNEKVYMTNDVVFYYRRHKGSMDFNVKNKMKEYRTYILNKNKSIVLKNLKKITENKKEE